MPKCREEFKYIQNIEWSLFYMCKFCSDIEFYFTVMTILFPFWVSFSYGRLTIYFQVLNVLLNMEKKKPDDKILSYNDVVLRRSDLDILSGPYFLNDRIIEFYFSYLTSCYPSEDILLVPPSISFWIKESSYPETLKDFIEPLHLSRRKLIIFPINDNEEVTIAEGGSHWSLLAFERSANTFVHHDSLNFNAANAKRVYSAVNSYTAPGATYIDCPSTPKQVNGYDCGLYITAITRSICEWYFSEAPKNMEDLWFSTITRQVTPIIASIMRHEILDLVRSLMANQWNRFCWEWLWLRTSASTPLFTPFQSMIRYHLVSFYSIYVLDTYFVNYCCLVKAYSFVNPTMFGDILNFR